MSNISFGSSYMVTKKDNPMGAYSCFVRYSLKKQQEENAFFDVIKKEIPKYPYQETVGYRLEVPNHQDNQVERYCSYMGIKYEKTTPEISMNKDEIVKRIAIPSSGMWQVEIDAKRLDELIEKQNSNIEHCKSDYYKYFKEQIEDILKSGEEFPTTTLCLNSRMPEEDLFEYIDNFGSDKLNEDELFIDFNQRTTMPDHCVFFALRDLGMDKIPVYVDFRQLELCDRLGLFE